MATLAQVKKVSRNSHRELTELALQKVPTGIRLLKCRGMAHDSRLHGFNLSDKGIAINGHNYQAIAAAQTQF